MVPDDPQPAGGDAMKINGTRKQKATELLRTLEQGPVFYSARLMTVQEAQEHVHLWLNSWIIPKVKELVPELRRQNLPSNVKDSTPLR